MRFSIILIVLFVNAFQAKSQSDNKYFKPGCYYDLNGEKKAGLVYLFSPFSNCIYFKSDKEAKREKINIDLITAVVINEDSLVVQTLDNKMNKKHFCRLMTISPVRKFFCFYTPNFSGTSPTMAISTTASTSSPTGFRNNLSWTAASFNYAGLLANYTYQEGNTTYLLTKSNYIEILTEAFADFPELVERIKTKDIKYKEIGLAFKMYKSHRVD